MPTYEYECKKCEGRFEVIASMSEPTLRKVPRDLAPCGKPKCNAPCRRVMSAPNVNLRQGKSETIQKPDGHIVKHWDGRQDATVKPKSVTVKSRVKESGQ